MRYIALILILFLMSGCALGAATSGYSLASKTADELSPKARQSMIDEIMIQVKQYIDARLTN